MARPASAWRLAAFAHRASRRMCSAAHADGDCGWYHGTRPYWVALGLLTSAARHADFFQRLLIAHGPKRVLVSGTADHAMPSLVCNCCPTAEVTVVDRCPTPCLVTRRWARRQGMRITTAIADVRDHQPGVRYDAICTHSFISWFPPSQRRDLYSRWAEMLVPGGRLITVVRLRPPGDESELAPYGDEEQERFVAQTRRRLAELGQVGQDIETIDELARAYARRKATYSVRDPERLIEELKSAGFEVQANYLGAVNPAAREWRAERGPSGTVDYLGIEATRL